MAVSDADINAYVQANIGNPQAIADAAQQYGVSPERLSQVTGYDMGTVNSYFGNAGINMWGQPEQPANLPPVQPVVQQAAPQPILQNQVAAPAALATDGIASLNSNYPAADVASNANNVLSGNILAGASWNSTNNTLADQLTEATGQQTLNTAVGGATTADTLKQLNDFEAGGGSFAPGSTVFLQTGGVDMLQGVDDETIRGNIDQIVSRLEDKGVNVVLTASPRAGSINDVVSNNFETGPASFYSDIAANHKNVAVVDSMGNILQDKSLLRDNLHTNAAGEQIYNKSVIDAYNRLVNKGADHDTALTIAKEIATETPPAPVAQKELQYGTVTPYTTSQIKDYVAGVMNDKSLAPWEQTNKIMERAQQAGISPDDLKAIYGKDVVDPYLKTYGAGIKDYITNTLSDKTKSDFDKVATINQAASKYGLDADEIAKYSGLNKTGVDKMFTAFDDGLASIAKNLSAPTVSDLDKTKGALALQQKYGVSDDQLAKALGGNVTGKDVAAYLEPVKTFSTKLQDLTADQTKTASDIQTFLDNAKKDPRIEGLYGLAIDKVQKAVPILGLRDSLEGNGTPEQLAKGYTDFVAAVNADPALREKYGTQADAIKKVADMSQRIADEKFGGKLQPHMFETFLGLDKKTMADVPKQLETTKPETRTVTDNEGQTQTYTVPGQVKDTKGLEPVYNIMGSGENETRELAGYTKPVKTAAGVIVDAQYDANGTLTGYRGRPEDKVWPQHRVGITGVWDAEGKAKPEQRVETPGFAKSVMQDLSDLGPIGQLAIAAATGGLGSLATGALQGALGPTLAKVVGSGLVGGTMSEIGGGKFGKGFLTGAAGAGTNALAKNFMPTIDTGSAFADQYLTKALPNLATSAIGAAINKQDIGQAGLSSLINTGTNMATSSLINSAMPDTLTPEMQKMFTGVSGQLLTNLLQGQTPDMQKAIMGTIMQNAMSPSKTTAKEKG